MEVRSPQQVERERILRKRQLLALLLVALLTAVIALVIGVTYKKYLMKEIVLWAINNGHSVMRQDARLSRALITAPLNYIQAVRAKEDLPSLVIDIKFKYFKELQKKRDEAVTKGFLIKDSDDFVPAAVRMNGKTIKVNLRLKGDLTDHLQGNKWSYRIKVQGEDRIFGLKTFSIQHPGTRSFQAQPLFFEILREHGVLTPRYFFVDVTVNGKDVGIMAVEEHFSKELLESQKRRESVILKFDESMFWDEWIALGARGPVFDNYKNATIDAFGSAKILKSVTLSVNYATAVGLLRGFVNGELPASDVFDTELMGRFLAISELWGAEHGANWNNMRFYFNPITAKLEPVAFDSFRKLLREESFNVISSEEPVVRALLSDREIFESYARTAQEMIKEIENGGLIRKRKEAEHRYLAALRKEFPMLEEFPYEIVTAHAEKLSGMLINGIPASFVANKKQERAYPKYRYPMLLHVYTVYGEKGTYLELDNAVPEEVEIKSIRWISGNGKSTPFKPASEITFPMHLQPTPGGALPNSRQIYYEPISEGGDYSIRVIAGVKGSEKVYETDALPYYPPLKHRVIPASSLQEQLSQHPFLKADTEKKVLHVAPGKWKISDPLIVPPGFSLEIMPSTMLRFAPDAGLISYGGLDFHGTEKGPIVFEGISSSWQGLLILNAPSPSKWSHVTVNNTSGMKRPGWELTSGATFYQSDIEMERCTFTNNVTEDALNIVRSKFKLTDLKFVNTASDAFDSDFSEGAVEGGLFQDIGKAGGGDGIDVSGSYITVNGSHFRNINDKALSVGEASKMKAAHVIVESAGTGAASKDGSLLEISDSSVNQVVTAGLMAYIKKPEYGAASIDAGGLKFGDNVIHARAQKGSSITIDGAPVETEDVDVDQLYKTVMKKGFRR
ncbi:MAG: CotH kinase family protein [Nitrospirae bacterium]|nr:CotH kinase family protein [Nitrospirota bacterium]